MATSMTVSQRVWDDYAEVDAGAKPSDIAKATNRTASTVSANVKRVREAIANGRDVTVNGGNGDTTTTPSTTGGKVDPYAIAEDIHAGASMFVREVEKVASERARVNDRITVLTNDLQALEAREDGVRDLAKSAGFDFDAWSEAVEAAGTETPAETPANA